MTLTPTLGHHNPHMVAIDLA